MPGSNTINVQNGSSCSLRIPIHRVGLGLVKPLNPVHAFTVQEPVSSYTLLKAMEMLDGVSPSEFCCTHMGV